MTYQSLGYWIGQANDTSTGRHPTGWTSGQRWSETAAEWLAMYDAMVAERDALQTALSAMTVQRDLWKSRADQAWGRSRQWNLNESWEAEANRVRPPVAVAQLSATQTRSNPNGAGNMCSLTTTLTGYWRLSFTGNADVDGNASPMTYSLIAAGGTVDSGVADVASGPQMHGKLGLTALIGPTGPVECHVNMGPENQFGSITGTLVATYVPIEGYPH